MRTMKQAVEQHKNIKTEKPRLPAGTSYVVPLFLFQVAAITHGSPRPRKTLTEFEPVTLPTAESAYCDYCAATILAKVSGSEVPMATNVMAVTDGSKPATHPRTVATSPTTAVTIPINDKAMRKAGIPPPIFGGGTRANNTFHPIVAKCIKASPSETSSTIKLS